MAIQNKDDYFKGWQLFHIGSLYWNIEDYKTALEYHHQAFRNLTPKAMFDNYGVISLLSFARLFTLLHQYDSAKYYYSFVDTSNPRGRRFYLAHIGEYYFALKQYDKALPNFTRALNYHRQLNDRNWIMHTLLDIAKTYLAIGNDDSAFVYVTEGFSITCPTIYKRCM